MAEEQNYWPGFVDALSNVVLTLLFVLVVFILALVLVSNKVEEKAMEMVEQVKQEHQTKEEAVELQKKLEEMAQRLEAVEKEKQQLKKSYEEMLVHENVIDERVVSSREGGELKSNYIVIQLLEDRIVLKYPKDISALDDEAVDEFIQVLEKVRTELGGNIKIDTHVGDEAFTSAHRLAYYRALSIRNRLLMGKYSEGEKIRTRIVENKDGEQARVEIIFK